MASTVFTISLVGEEQVTKLNSKTTFTVDEKLEKTINLNNSSEVIDYSYIDDPYLFIFEGSGEFNVAITAGGNTITYAIDNSYIFTPTSSFASTISNITISETSSVDVVVNVRIYSKAVVS